MNKILVLGFVCLLLAGCIGVLNYDDEQSNVKEIKVFQGPVPEGYDLEHFVKTGITEKTTNEKILEQFGDVEYEKGTLVNGEKIVEYNGSLKDYQKKNGVNN